MRLTRMLCDGCGRTPTFWEWFRGEFSAGGYYDWRHPGIAFKEAGVPMLHETQRKAERLFVRIFNRPLPEELGYLCPNCQARVAREVPGLASSDPGDSEPDIRQQRRQEEPKSYFGS